MNDLSNQSVLSKNDYKDIESEDANNTVDELSEYNTESSEPTEEQIAADKALRDAHKRLKSTLKRRSKSELIEIIFSQGLQQRRSEALSQKLFEDNKNLIKELEKYENSKKTVQP